MHPNNFRRYERMRRKRRMKNISILLLLFIIGAVIGFFFVQENGILHSLGFIEFESKENLSDIEVSVETPLEEENLLEDVERTNKAVYFNSSMASNSQYIGEIFSLIDLNEVNSLIIPLKNDDGTFNYKTLIDYKTADDITTNLTDIIEQALIKDVKLIAEISVYKDNNFARRYTDASFKATYKADWLDSNLKRWITPYSQEGQDYIETIIDEILAMGFDEILLKDFYFPVIGQQEYMSLNLDISKEQILLTRLEQLSNKYDISLVLSEFALNNNSQVSGENASLMSNYVKNIYIDVVNDDVYNQYLGLEIENKGIISNNQSYLENEQTYILN